VLEPSFAYRHAEPAEDADVFAELGRRKLKMWAARFGSAALERRLVVLEDAMAHA
jgi:hypothetical protein